MYRQRLVPAVHCEVPGLGRALVRPVHRRRVTDLCRVPVGTDCHRWVDGVQQVRGRRGDQPEPLE